MIREAGAGDPEEAEKRLRTISDVSTLELNEDVHNLSRDLLVANVVPEEYAEDAIHIALASVHGMEYLVTWNCTHIANAQIRTGIEDVCLSASYEPPIICTPEELMREDL